MKSTVPFDTLEIMIKLRDAGIQEEKAIAITKVFTRMVNDFLEQQKINKKNMYKEKHGNRKINK